MIWTELLFSYFPINREMFWQQMLARLFLLVLVWLTGFIAYTADGLTMQYVSNMQVYSTLFGSSFIILFGSYMMQTHLHEIILSFRPLIRLDESLFRKFVEKLERYSFSFIPCLLIGFVIIGFSSNLPAELQTFSQGFQPHAIWNLLFTIFTNLLSGTGTWFVVSIWLTIFLISRQPLDVELSPIAVKEFRGLTVLTLYFSSFYFLTISIGIIIDLAGSPAMSLTEIILSPAVAFIAIGVISVLFPFYNIHRTLLGLKNQELQRIEGEFERLRRQLDEVLEKQLDQQFSNRTIAIMGRIFSLQMKERSVNAAPEWSIDISFLSRFLGLVFMPAIIRILVEIFNRFYL